MSKGSTSFRLSSKAKANLKKIATKCEFNQTVTLELIIGYVHSQMFERLDCEMPLAPESLVSHLHFYSRPKKAK